MKEDTLSTLVYTYVVYFHFPLLLSLSDCIAAYMYTFICFLSFSSLILSHFTPLHSPPLFSHPPLSPTHYSLPLYSVSIMRSAADVYQHHSLLLQAPNLNAVFDSLNVLGTCPWKINSKVHIHVAQITDMRWPY